MRICNLCHRPIRVWQPYITSVKNSKTYHSNCWDKRENKNNDSAKSNFVVESDYSNIRKSFETFDNEKNKIHLLWKTIASACVAVLLTIFYIKSSDSAWNVPDITGGYYFIVLLYLLPLYYLGRLISSNKKPTK